MIDQSFQADNGLVMQVLYEMASNDPLLKARLETAMWKAAALSERQKRESEQASPEFGIYSD